jgi:hypothetical protein
MDYDAMYRRQSPRWERLLTRAFIALLFGLSGYALWRGLIGG